MDVIETDRGDPDPGRAARGRSRRGRGRARRRHAGDLRPPHPARRTPRRPHPAPRTAAGPVRAPHRAADRPLHHQPLCRAWLRRPAARKIELKDFDMAAFRTIPARPHGIGADPERRADHRGGALDRAVSRRHHPDHDQPREIHCGGAAGRARAAPDRHPAATRRRGRRPRPGRALPRRHRRQHRALHHRRRRHAIIWSARACSACACSTICPAPHSSPRACYRSRSRPPPRPRSRRASSICRRQALEAAQLLPQTPPELIAAAAGRRPRRPRWPISRPPTWTSSRRRSRTSSRPSTWCRGWRRCRGISPSASRCCA